MAEFTVTQCFPTGRTREWQSPEGKTVVFNKHSVQFVETPGQSWEVERSGQNPPPTPGQKLQGDFQTSPKGTVYFKEIKPQKQWNGGGGGFRKFGGGAADTPEKQQSIMAQVALKEAVNVMIATQQFDLAKCQYYVQGFMEMMTKVAGMTVEAAVPANPQPVAPVQPMMAQPTNGHQQQPVNRVAQYAPQQQPQQVYQQQPQQYAQAPQQQSFYQEDEIPF